jgi:hypothetical protein
VLLCITHFECQLSPVLLLGGGHRHLQLDLGLLQQLNLTGKIVDFLFLKVEKGKACF